ncbi:high affinity sulfate transporter [Alcanivorax sp. 521-1]|uniref:High affinity sulfate transporter n=1 Tax=Alloalcanivorax profundimaris TaxID=2735259 RepID=A0ABS0AQ60_9GAMM|nr:SulP family inorganic anion transporter [Alloalcanivorax profundimaris]MBF5056145.1 high affinity sulfate transporter [Alloalcanivorax profundimaris]
MTVWTRLLPFLSWPRPTRHSLRQDAFAGVTVGLVLVPQALAYATLAGMPPVTGLYAALLPGVIGILWGSSPLLAVGPVALTSLLTFAALSPMATPESGEWVTLAIWLAIYAGVIQFLLGALRLGVIANFVSNAVITGFLNAAALIILVTQLPALLGLGGGGFGAALAALGGHLSHPDPAWLWTLAFGPGAVLLLFLQKRWWPRLPGVLVVCVLGILVSAVLGYAGFGGDVVGKVPAGLPALQWPGSLTLEQHRALLPAALIIALISFTEAMSSARALPSPDGRLWDQNQELVGQGLAKIASGLSGAFPVSGSFSRTALNRYVGATSGWSALFAALCTLLCLLFLTGYLQHLPRAVLAAIIMVPVFGLINPMAFARLWRASLDDGLVGIATFVVTLVSVPYLHWGVFTGFVLAMLFFLYRRAHPRLIELGLHPAGTLRDRRLHDLPPLAPGVLSLRLDASLTYLTAPLLDRFVRLRLRDEPDIRVVLICASAMNAMDATGAETLERLHRDLAGRGVRLAFSGVKKQVRDVMEHTGLLARLGEDNLFVNNREAIEALAGPGTAAG